MREIKGGLLYLGIPDAPRRAPDIEVNLHEQTELGAAGRRPWLGVCALTGALLLLVMGTWGCPRTQDDDVVTPGDDDGGDDDQTAGDPIEGTAVISPNPANRFAALATVVFDREVEVEVEYGAADIASRRTPVQAVAAGAETEILVLGLYADTLYTLRVHATDGAETWTSPEVTLQTEPLDEGWPTCGVVSHDERGAFTDEEVICTDSKLDDETPVYFCVDRWGQPVWELRHPNGDRMRHVRALSGGGFAASGHSRSFIALFDPAGRLLTEFKDLWFEDKTLYHHEWINQHEVIEITEGPWTGALAILTITQDEVDGKETAGAGIIIFDSIALEVLWDWSSHGELGDDWPMDPLLPYGRYGLLEPIGNEWLHANAVLHGLDDDGRQYMWVSLRAQDWIVKIDIETNAVVWRLGYEGDFALVDDLDAPNPVALEADLWMFQQHAPEFQSRNGQRSRFLVFDNGNVRPYPALKGWHYSRVAEFEIDEETMRATVGYSYGSDDPQSPAFFASDAYGDADMQPSGDSLLFVAGLIANPFSAFIAEVSYPGGEELWRFECPEGPGMYRVNYYPSLYDTTWWYEVER